MVTLVLLDLDGTLVDSSSEVAAAGRHALRVVGTEGPSFDVLRGRTGEAVDSLFREVGDDATRQQVIRVFRERLAEVAGSPDQVLPGVREGLERFRIAGVATAVATNKPAALASLVLERSRLMGLVDHVQGSDGLPPKPDPAILHAAGIAMGVQPTWLIGDTSIDVEAGRRAALPTICVTSGTQTLEELASAGAQRIVSTFAEAAEVVLNGTAG